jgi:CheY-like chemotaxis protein
MQTLISLQKNGRLRRRRESEGTTPSPMKTILYVEDDEHDVFFLKRAFMTHAPEWQVQNVHSIEDAVNYLNNIGKYSDGERFPAPDLVVSDVSIPGGSGYQLLSWVRAHAQLGRVPFILLTGSAQGAELDKAASNGANCCLEKSTDFKELLRNVHKLLEA